ncbi:IS5 family transposase [Xanthomonas maliensis]|uniref:IS5 family transposase n=3 Tax=Xanthomonas maliensis TaxID=1321368 RepID=UPI001264331D|nr:IS5 family transposase [Xanthomonas maliensis]KAB7762675.1 IS5/IS1182 family transposase [Xanthomonas maliensis]
MEITPEQFALIEHCLPTQRGNVSMTNLQVVNAMLYVAEHGCKWRGLPKRFGNWHTIYTRMRRWAKAGVLDRMFEELQREQVVRIKIEVVSLDSTSIKVHPDGTGAPKKNGPQSIGKSRGGWNTKIHMVAADARTAVTFCLSPGQAGDGPQGRRLLESLGRTSRPVHLLMDMAYQGDETIQLALDLGFIPVVPPNPQRLNPWEYDREMYKRRNEVERLFRRLKGFRRIFTRFEKLDAMFLAFLNFALVADGLRWLC